MKLLDTPMGTTPTGRRSTSTLAPESMVAGRSPANRMASSPAARQ